MKGLRGRNKEAELARIRGLDTRHGRIRLPNFLPDATRGTIRNVPSHWLHEAGVEVLMTNAYHLAERPGADAIGSMGGLHEFMGFDRPIATDSGGFQLWSLARERRGKVNDKGFVTTPSKGNRRVYTPERAMQAQLKLGSDIAFCLDECTHPKDALEVQERSVKRTVRWAKQCKQVLERRAPEDRPLLYGVIQGGQSEALRRQCVEQMVDIGFDGYGFGGVPFDQGGQHLVDEVYLVAELLPPDKPRHALGVGRPDSVLAAWRAGWHTFDSVAPTREARRGLIYVPLVDLDDPHEVYHSDHVFEYLDASSPKAWRDRTPIDETCPCPLCQNYSRGYLAHLFRTEDPVAGTLATLHNLTFLHRLVATLRRIEDRISTPQGPETEAPLPLADGG
ncbi:MAG: tRNA guanosine(34) transglycosylase Tgt [Myxococcota bacterium]